MAEPAEILGEIADPTWHEVKVWVAEQLVMHRRGLEMPGLPHDETEGHRYAIAVLKGLLKFHIPSKMGDTVSGEPD